jgi:hypothetical protein
VPIVCISGDPVGTGLAASLSRPGGNVTGLSLLAVDYSEKWLELLKEVRPKLHRVAVLWNADNPSIVSGDGTVAGCSIPARLCPDASSSSFITPPAFLEAARASLAVSRKAECRIAYRTCNPRKDSNN